MAAVADSKELKTPDSGDVAEEVKAILNFLYIGFDFVFAKELNNDSITAEQVETLSFPETIATIKTMASTDPISYSEPATQFYSFVLRVVQSAEKFFQVIAHLVLVPTEIFAEKETVKACMKELVARANEKLKGATHTYERSRLARFQETFNQDFEILAKFAVARISWNQVKTSWEETCKTRHQLTLEVLRSSDLVTVPQQVDDLDKELKRLKAEFLTQRTHMRINGAHFGEIEGELQKYTSWWDRIKTRMNAEQEQLGKLDCGNDHPTLRNVLIQRERRSDMDKEAQRVSKRGEESQARVERAELKHEQDQSDAEKKERDLQETMRAEERVVHQRIKDEEETNKINNTIDAGIDAFKTLLETWSTAHILFDSLNPPADAKIVFYKDKSLEHVEIMLEIITRCKDQLDTQFTVFDKQWPTLSASKKLQQNAVSANDILCKARKPIQSLIRLQIAILGDWKSCMGCISKRDTQCQSTFQNAWQSAV